MSRRKQGSRPQQRRSSEDDSEMEAMMMMPAMWGKPPSSPGHSDLLTCGQCQCTFPLRHILSFIEHKRIQCNPSRYCQDRGRQGRSPSPASARGDRSPQLSEAESKPLVQRERSVTDDSEPSCYTCTTCNDQFTSAWFLLHHAQNTHGLQIYLSTEEDHLPLVKQFDDCAYQVSHLLPQPYDLSDRRRSSSTTRNVTEDPEPSTGRFQESNHSPSMPDFSGPGKDLLQRTQHLHFDINEVVAHRGSQERKFFPFQPTSVQEEALNFSTKLRELAGNSFSHSPVQTCQVRASSPFFHVPPGVLGEEVPLEVRRRSCEFCGKTFKSLSNLVVHRRSHTGEKPYQCRFCDHACTQSSKLKRHMKVHRLKEGLEAGEDCSGDTDAETLENGLQDDEGRCAELEDMRKSDEESNMPDAEDQGLQDHQEGLQDPPMCINFILSEKHLRDKKPVHDPEAGTESGNLYERRKASDSAEKRALFVASAGFYHPKARMLELKDQAQDGEVFSTSIRAPDFSLPKRSPPSPENLLCYIKKRVKLESESEPLLPLLPPALHTFYSQWLTSCSESQSFVKELFPGFREARPSLFTNSSERSFDAGHSQVTPGDDSSEEALSSESGIASGNCTPKQNGLDRGGCKRSDTCEFCGKVFRNSSNLTVHRRSHTGERPYRCQLCSYACAQSSKLTRHMKTHLQDGKPAFQCEKCNIPFSVFSTLEKHMKKYHGASFAGSEFSRVSEMD